MTDWLAYRHNGFVFSRGPRMATIELTDEQRQALEAEQREPLDVVDPATQQHYALLARELYERVRTLLEEQATEPGRYNDASSQISPGMLRCQKAFWQDLPELLRDKRNRGKWVAYHHEERITLGKNRRELYQDCLRRGFQRGEFYVCQIEERTIPPWIATAVEESLYEFTDAPTDLATPPE